MATKRKGSGDKAGATGAAVLNNYENIPQELKELKQWVVWRVVEGTKRPFVAAGKCTKNARSNDAKTYRTYKQACAAVERGAAEGIGFVFTEDDPYVGIDLDNKQDDPEKDESNRAWVKRFDSYTEVSPSGKGYHIIVKGEMGRGLNSKGFEAYGQGRYFTFTGDVVLDQPIVDGGKTLPEFVEAYRKGGDDKPFSVSGPLVEGTRNDTLFRLGCSMRMRGFSAEDVKHVIGAAGVGAGLLKEEVHKLLAQIESYEDYPEGDDKITYTELFTDHCIWVKAQERWWDVQSSRLLTAGGVDNSYHHRCAAYKDDKDEERHPRPSQIFSTLEHVTRTDEISWHPGHGRIFEHEGTTVLNSYRPSQLAQTTEVPAVPVPDEDVVVWLDEVAAIIPNPEERAHVLDWMAHTAQHPGTKINHAVFLGGDEGIGKDFILEPLRLALGDHNTRAIRASKLESDHNEYLWRTKLLVINEMHSGVFAKAKTEQELKEILAAPPDTVILDIKYVREVMMPNLFSVVFFANDKKALVITNDYARRYFCVWSNRTPITDPAENSGYWTPRWQWLKENTGLLYQWLMTRDLSRFSAQGRPPMTEFTRQVIWDSRPAVEQAVRQMIEDEAHPFDYPLLTAEQVSQALEDGNLLSKREQQSLTTTTIGRALRACGLERHETQTKIKGRNRKRYIWSLRDHEQYAKMQPKARLTAWDKQPANRSKHR